MSHRPVTNERVAVLGAVSLLCACPGLLLSQTRQLPEGAGKITLQRVCSGCHAAEIVVGRHETKERWEQIVGEMVEKGANGTDDEFNQIIDYLAVNFGKAKTNTSASHFTFVPVSEGKP